MKKLIAGLGMAVLVLGVAGTALAATVDNVNDDSLVNILARWRLHVNMTNSNSAAITNDVSATASSGYNSFVSADDQSGSSLTTGDAAAAVVVDNTANSNSMTLDVESADGTDATVTNVTDESTATVDTADCISEDMTNDNSVAVTNDTAASSETGFNSFTSGDSLTNSTATTGYSEAATGVSNLFNFNIKEVIRTIRASL